MRQYLQICIMASKSFVRRFNWLKIFKICRENLTACYMIECCKYWNELFFDSCCDLSTYFNHRHNVCSEKKLTQLSSYWWNILKRDYDIDLDDGCECQIIIYYVIFIIYIYYPHACLQTCLPLYLDQRMII